MNPMIAKFEGKRGQEIDARQDDAHLGSKVQPVNTLIFRNPNLSPTPSPEEA
jgi:hypothetical protein